MEILFNTLANISLIALALYFLCFIIKRLSDDLEKKNKLKKLKRAHGKVNGARHEKAAPAGTVKHYKR